MSLRKLLRYSPMRPLKIASQFLECKPLIPNNFHSNSYVFHCEFPTKIKYHAKKPRQMAWFIYLSKRLFQPTFTPPIPLHNFCYFIPILRPVYAELILFSRTLKQSLIVSELNRYDSFTTALNNDLKPYTVV